MNEEYHVFEGERGDLDPSVEKSIQLDIFFMRDDVRADVLEADPIYIADVDEYKAQGLVNARLLGYAPGSKKVHYTTNVMAGEYDLVAPLEELNDSHFELADNPTCISMDLLKKLRDVVREKILTPRT